MNDPNWNARAFVDLVARLKSLGVDARLPLPGEGPDVYTATLMGYVLDAAGKPVDPAFIDFSGYLNAPPIQTPRAHVNEGGRSYRIEGAIQDGEFFKPGQPLPPVKHEGGQ